MTLWKGFRGRAMAIDPGGSCLGWAVFDGGLMVDVGLSRCSDKLVGERARFHSLLRARFRPDRTVSEMMRYRPGKGKRIPPQDLIELNLIAGHIAQEWVYPEEWKGHVPKHIHQQRILAAMSDEEKDILESVRPPSLRHNAIDAIGIGLYCLGRLGVRHGERDSAPKPLVFAPRSQSAGWKRRGAVARARSPNPGVHPKPGKGGPRRGDRVRPVRVNGSK